MSAIGPNRIGVDPIQPKFYQRKKKGGLDSTGEREKEGKTVSDPDTVVEGGE